MTRCLHCQQAIRHDGLAWFHVARQLAYCVPIPGTPFTYATPEVAQK